MTARSGGVGSCQYLVKCGVQQVCRGRCTRELLYDVCAIIQVGGGRTTDGFADAATEWVILEVGGQGAADGRQLISRAPGIRVRSVTCEIAVRVVSERSAAPLRELVVGIVHRRT